MPTILLKKSDTPSAVPGTASLTNLAGGAEVAVNTADRRMFTMTSSSAVVELGTNPSSLTCADASLTVARIGSLTVSTLAISGVNFASASITNLTATSATITTLTGTSATITTILDGAGNVRKIPSAGAAKTSVYTLSVSDVGEFVTLSTGGAVDVPNDVFSAGDAVSIFNNTTATATISLTVATAYVSGTNADVNSVNLSTRGVATVLFVNPSLCVLIGSVA